MRPRSTAAVLVTGALLAGLGGAVAGAHTQAAKTYPANGSTVSKRTSKATVTFGQIIRSGRMTVRGPRGVVSRRAQVSRADRRKLYATLKRPLASGRYRVTWRIKAADGHVQEGSWTFRVR